VIEVLLQAERLLTMGQLDQAEQLYRKASEADPQNAIAVVGLARVALERGDDRRALELGTRALEVDPQNAAAQRMVRRLGEVLETRGQPVGAAAAASPDPATSATPAAPGSGRAPLWRRLLGR
jgi:tetratricopeptide (TPR) repeat protein